MSFNRLQFGVVATVAVLCTACDDPLALPDATQENIVDTVTVYALTGTSIGLASGYNIILRTLARTERTSEPFDFAFDLDSMGDARLFTTGALGLTPVSAHQFSDREFGDIEIAPLDDYIRDSSFVVVPEDVFIIRSRPSNLGCIFFLGALPRYGKFRVLSLDATERSITFETLVNVNCGYRSLAPGIPER